MARAISLGEPQASHSRHEVPVQVIVQSPGEYGLWRVTGSRAYRGHLPGAEFEARLEIRASQRAIARGDIALVRHIRPTLKPGSYTFPRGWLEKAAKRPDKQARASGFSNPRR